jgi:hypothetical protein
MVLEQVLRVSGRAYGAGHEGGRRRGDAGVHERGWRDLMLYSHIPSWVDGVGVEP